MGKVITIKKGNKQTNKQTNNGKKEINNQDKISKQGKKYL